MRALILSGGSGQKSLTNVLPPLVLQLPPSIQAQPHHGVATLMFNQVPLALPW